VLRAAHEDVSGPSCALKPNLARKSDDPTFDFETLKNAQK
jgi:hypothetical protein